MSNTYAWTTPGSPKRKQKLGGYNSYYSNVYSQYDYEWMDEKYGIESYRKSMSGTREVTVEFTEYEKESPVGPEVESVLEFLESAGYYKAASISRAQAERFAEKFDASDLWDLAEMLDAQEIDEYQFIQLVSDFRRYREMVCGC